MNNKCYICGLDRYVFEKNADGFTNHIERDHQCWNYLYYVYYVTNKDSTELNGIESYVNDLIEKTDITWFPIMKSISTGAENSEEDENVKKIQGELKDINNQFNLLKTKVAQIK